MNTLSYKTVSAKKETVERKWWVVDAEGETVGRLSTKIAAVLMGKTKPSFTPARGHRRLCDHNQCGESEIYRQQSRPEGISELLTLPGRSEEHNR